MNIDDLQRAIRNLPLTADNLIELVRVVAVYAGDIAKTPRASDEAHECVALLDDALIQAEGIYLEARETEHG